MSVPPDVDSERLYEERLTIGLADSFEHAISLAQDEAVEYAADIDGQLEDLFQAYEMCEPPSHGQEIFSLIRGSSDTPHDYIDRYFATGRERQTDI